MEDSEKCDLYVVYVHFVGIDSDGLRVYHFIVTDEPDNVFGEAWGEKPACNCPNLMPPETQYRYIKELRTDIILDLAQDECCHSMQDARDLIIAIAAENLDEYEEYPSNGRIVVHFGDNLDDVEERLSKRELKMKFI